MCEEKACLVPVSVRQRKESWCRLRRSCKRNGMVKKGEKKSSKFPKPRSNETVLVSQVNEETEENRQIWNRWRDVDEWVFVNALCFFQKAVWMQIKPRLSITSRYLLSSRFFFFHLPLRSGRSVVADLIGADYAWSYFPSILYDPRNILWSKRCIRAKSISLTPDKAAKVKFLLNKGVNFTAGQL